MRKLSAAFVSAVILASVSAQAQTAQTPGPLTTPGSMNNTQPISPATHTPYAPQVNMNSSMPATPQSTAIDPATGTYYQPQVNMNGPATNDPGVVNTPTPLTTTTPTAPQQPNVMPTTTAPVTPQTSSTPATTPQ